MIAPSDIARIVRHRLAFADLKIFSEVLPFRLEAPEFGFDIRGWQVSLLHPVFDAMVLDTRRHGPIVVQNTYLSSFSYNIAAAWDAYYDDTREWVVNPEHPLSRAMSYNFKKFYAEQILRRTHNIFGIAIFLETLLYDEEIMHPILSPSKGDFGESRGRHFRAAANVLNSVVLFHEIGHLLHRSVKEFGPLLARELPPSLAGVRQFWAGLGKVSEEFICDAFALWLAARHAFEPLTTVERHRLAVFGFSMFAALHALDESARATAKEYPGEAEDPGRSNIRDSMAGAGYVITSVNQLQLARSHAASVIANDLAVQAGVDLYSRSGSFRIYPTVMDDVATFLPSIIDRSAGSHRGMCEMLARALHGHREGVDFLTWRSKTYQKAE